MLMHRLNFSSRTNVNIQYDLNDWKGHHDAIFVDSTGKYNMLAGVPLTSLELVGI